MQLESHYKQFEQLFNDLVGKEPKFIAQSPNEGLYKAAVMFFFIKSWKTFQGIFTLCNIGLGEDAGILLRSLFEMTVNLMYISKDPLERARLFVEYDFVQRQQLHEKFSRKKADPSYARILAAATLDTVEELENNYKRVKKNYPNKRSWSGKSLADMAKDVSFEWQYDYIYWVLSHLVHPNPKAIDKYMRMEEGSIVIANASSKEDIERVWVSACGFLLLFFDRFNVAFSIGCEQGVEDAKKTLGSIVTEKKSNR